MAEFSPDELDQIEDLLEDLETHTGLGELDLPEAARERLGEYQDILALSREALPMEEPDPGLLAGVMAEARQSAFNATATAAGVVAAAREVGASDEARDERPWYARWLPAMTLAASAAAVLLWMRPGTDAPDEAASGTQPLAQADRAALDVESAGTASSAAVSPSADAGPEAVASGGAAKEPVELPDSSARDDEAIEEEAATRGQASAPSKRPALPSKARASSKPQAKDAPEPEPPPVDKDQAWDDLTRAHGMRVRGECRSARTLYRGLELEGLKSNVRAQALAGRGLCEEFNGDSASAEALFSRARAIRGDIDGWIAAERQDMFANGHMRKKAPSKAKKKRAPKKAKSDEL